MSHVVATIECNVYRMEFSVKKNNNNNINKTTTHDDGLLASKPIFLSSNISALGHHQ